MEQYTEKQYDDDLTVVADEYNDSFQTDNVDLFEFPSYDESPIAKLKSLVLSIDWEITDDILRQFNEELLDLKDIWAGEKIYLVYVQALEKISKYIYQEKADSNPNAIKLLLTFYYNLEKIISSEDMPEEEKKQILLEDVKRFEKLKQQIGKAAKAERKKTDLAEDRVSEFEASGASAAKNFLLDLKAIVLGIDWEITEKDLGKLRDEVIRLEGVFSGSRPKLIFLQGIGSLGAYIRLKKSNAHADAFKLLHSFFAGLEKIVSTPLTLEEEKAILFPEVEKFNTFKVIVGSTISSESIQAGRDEEFSEDDEEVEEGGLSPAFSDLPEGETRGFQEEEEAASLGLPSTLNVASQIDMFFSEEPDAEQLHVDSAKISASLEKDTRDEFRDAAEAQLDSIFQTDSVEDGSSATLYVGQDAALRGVDVETEADDDSGEEDLPLEAGQLAPALAELGTENWKELKILDKTEKQAELAGDLETRLDDFFAEEMERAEDTPVLSLSEDEFADIGNESAKILVDEESSFKEQVVLPGVDVESEDDDASDEEVLMFAGGDLASALSEEPITDFSREAETALENAAETLFVSDEPLPALPGSLREESAGAGLPSADSETEVALEDHLESFFALEEVDEKTSVESRQENFEQHLRSDELFVEPTGDIISQEISIAATQEEQHQAVVESEPALAFFAEVQPTVSLFEQEVLGGEDDHGPVSEAVQLISTPEEPEEVVFELVEEAEELFFSSTEEENLIESQKKDEGQVAEAEDLSLDFEPEASSALPEGVSALKTGEIDRVGAFDKDAEASVDIYAATAFIAEPSLQDEDNEFLAVFEEVGEEAAVDDLPLPQLSAAVQAAQFTSVEHGQVEIP
ncbi:MAG: hypothetical protein Q8R88_10240, partial [Desulfoprunum sp.]|nr:hypothetical protein [Desulfoprunum sp.]